MKVPSFSYSRMVDLSRTISPSEGRLIHYRTARVPVDDPPTDRWYITTSIEMGGHAGTHVEGPLHAVQDGPAIADLDVERFFGEAIVFDFSDAPLGEPLSPAQFQRAAEPGGGVRPGTSHSFALTGINGQPLVPIRLTLRPRPCAGSSKQASNWSASTRPA